MSVKRLFHKMYYTGHIPSEDEVEALKLSPYAAHYDKYKPKKELNFDKEFRNITQGLKGEDKPKLDLPEPGFKDIKKVVLNTIDLLEDEHNLLPALEEQPEGMEDKIDEIKHAAMSHINGSDLDPEEKRDLLHLINREDNISELLGALHLRLAHFA